MNARVAYSAFLNEFKCRAVCSKQVSIYFLRRLSCHLNNSFVNHVLCYYYRSRENVLEIFELLLHFTMSCGDSLKNGFSDNLERRAAIAINKKS